MRMKKILFILFAFLSLSATRASAQLGFDFGMNFEFLSRDVPDGFKSSGFGMGPYAGIIYGIPVTMSDMVSVGLNYKFDIIYGAPGTTWDDNLLCPITLLNNDTDIREQHLQVPVMFNHNRGIVTISAGPVFDYCLSSKVSSTNATWPYRDENGKAIKMDSIKDLGMKPFNVYLKAGAGIGLKAFSFNLTASYGLLDLSPDGTGLRRWAAGMDMHLVF